MKQKIHAGATMDAATPEEVKHIIGTQLKSWQHENVEGLHMPRFSTSTQIAGGAFAVGLGGGGSQPLGPADGFVWDVRRLRITGLLGADTAGVWINSQSPATLVATTADVASTAGSGVLFLFHRQLILQPGEVIVVAGSGLVASTGQITINGQAVEVPTQQKWRLIG